MLQVQRKFWGKRPGFDIGDVLHVGVNIIFALVLFLFVRYWNLAFLAAFLVLLSKWRILAVQPRFWLPNLKTNLADIVVGLSTVILLFQAESDAIAIFWMVLYLGWLLFLKPQTSDLMVGVQALWSQFLGILTIFAMPFMLEYSFVGILLVWVVAWSTARHFSSNYEEPHYKALSMVWGFLVAQLAWIGFHWISYYQLFGLNVSNVALIVTVMAGVLGALYHAYKVEKVNKSVVVENAIFGAVLLALILATSSWTTQL